MILKDMTYYNCLLIKWISKLSSAAFYFAHVNYMVLTRALALNCNVPVNDKNGAESKNWKEGKPVRVVRSCKGRKHSKYSPEEGNRYDGIYKV